MTAGSICLLRTTKSRTSSSLTAARGILRRQVCWQALPVNAMGLPRSGMGVDAADINQDGWLDLFLTNVDHEMFSLYRNHKDMSFDDLAIPTGIGAATMLLSGWGVKLFDYDNDGDLDLLIANGHPDTTVEKRIQDVRYYEPMLLFRHSGDKWENVSARSGPIFSKNLAARGMAIGDFDNDGAVDVLVAVNDAAPVLLRNHSGRQNHWLGVRLIGKKANVDAIGAKVFYRPATCAAQLTRPEAAAMPPPTIPAWCWVSGSERKWTGSKSPGHNPAARSNASPIFRWIATSLSSKARGSGARNASPLRAACLLDWRLRLPFCSSPFSRRRPSPNPDGARRP